MKKKSPPEIQKRSEAHRKAIKELAKVLSEAEEITGERYLRRVVTKESGKPTIEHWRPDYGISARIVKEARRRRLLRHIA